MNIENIIPKARHPDDDTKKRLLSVAQLQLIAERAYAQGAAAERERACHIVTGLCISDNNAREINEAIRGQS